MENDPLQQLRDVHLPPDPSWWPPAVGWWLLAALLLVALFWTVQAVYRAYRRRAPLREAKAILQELEHAYQQQHISAEDYLHQGNELLKRVLVRGYGLQQYAPLSGAAWLQALDELSGTDRFSTGYGRVLGEARFSPAPDIDVAALNRELQLVLARVKV